MAKTMAEMVQVTAREWEARLEARRVAGERIKYDFGRAE